MWAIKGHPRRGGSVENISGKIGPLGNGAWCKAPDNTLYVLTKSGMVTISPQDGAIPALVSKEKIPNSLIGLAFDTLNPTITMAYDTVWNGVIINVRQDINETSWWFDPAFGGFHQMAYVNTAPPSVMLTFPVLDTATASGTLFGSSTGLFRFDAEGTTDTNFDFNIFIGPIKISPNAALKSKLETAKIVVGLDTVPGASILQVVVGTDSEECFNNALFDRAGSIYEVSLATLVKNNGYLRPQLSGHATILAFAGSGPFVFESADIDFIEAGRMRAARNYSMVPRVLAGPDQTLEYILP
jgi:hypothetical protein